VSGVPCDPFAMGVIHRAFRAEFGNLPDLIRGVRPGDTKRSKLVGSHLENMIAVLHHHHAAEDELLWPKLAVRVPNRDSDVRLVERQHADIGGLIDTVNAARRSWRESANPEAGEHLAAAVGELSACVNEHLEDEESRVVPLIAEYITPAEWQAATDRGAEFLTPRNVGFAVAFAGFIEEHSTPEEWRRFLAELPFAPRLLTTLVGPRLFTSYKTKLYA
jgi:hypothetical protein